LGGFLFVSCFLTSAKHVERDLFRAEVMALVAVEYGHNVKCVTGDTAVQAGLNSNCTSYHAITRVGLARTIGSD